jgi:hypothetical protein
MAMVAGLITKLTQVDLQRLWRALAAKWPKRAAPEESIEAGATVEIILSEHAVHYPAKKVMGAGHCGRQPDGGVIRVP